MWSFNRNKVSKTKLEESEKVDLSEEDKKLGKNLYSDLSKQLAKTAGKEAEKFDKGILTLSSIFLGFTITFVDKIITVNIAWYKWMLYGSWITLYLAIVSTLIGLLVNMQAISQIIINAGKFFLEGNLQYKEFYKNRFNTFAQFSNWLSLFLFVIGTGLFVLFVLLNVNNKI